MLEYIVEGNQLSGEDMRKIMVNILVFTKEVGELLPKQTMGNLMNFRAKNFQFRVDGGRSLPRKVHNFGRTGGRSLPEKFCNFRGNGGGAPQEKFSNFRDIFDDFVTLKERKKHRREK